MLFLYITYLRKVAAKQRRHFPSDDAAVRGNRDFYKWR